MKLRTLIHHIICYFLLEIRGKCEAVTWGGRLGAEGKSEVQIWSRKLAKRLQMLPRAMKALKSTNMATFRTSKLELTKCI